LASLEKLRTFTILLHVHVQYRSEISVHRIRTLYAHTHTQIRRLTYADTHTQIRRYADTHTQIRSSLLFIALGFHCVVLLEKTNEISLRENYNTALVDRVVRDLHI
jgi:hypothetical protein